jgi:L-fucose mutarotase
MGRQARPVRLGAYERFDFYAAARRAFAIIRTSDTGPYGCFILKKGVISAGSAFRLFSTHPFV